MEELDATIIAELKEKAIERGDDDDVSIEDNTLDEDVVKAPEPDQSVASAKPAPKKSKKVRSEKQKAAFEKARIARAENLRIKREIAAEKKAEKKKEKEAVQAEVAKRLQQKQPKLPVPVKEDADRYLKQPTIPQAYEQQITNHYYYYGEQPPQKKKKGRRAKPPRPPTPSESESSSEEESGGANFIYSDEEEEEEVDMPPSFKELQNYDEGADRYTEPEQPQLKFRFA